MRPGCWNAVLAMHVDLLRETRYGDSPYRHGEDQPQQHNYELIIDPTVWGVLREGLRNGTLYGEYRMLT